MIQFLRTSYRFLSVVYITEWLVGMVFKQIPHNLLIWQPIPHGFINEKILITLKIKYTIIQYNIRLSSTSRYFIQERKENNPII